MKNLSSAVIGVGYLGQYHAEKHHNIEGIDLKAVVDADANRAEEIATRLDTHALSDYQSLLGKVDLVSIASPTASHYQVAKDFLQAGSHVLVEKPITVTVEQAQELVDIAKHKNLVLQVGHLERFNPALLGVEKQLLKPMFIESHRLAPFTPRGADVNVILDLMIHDIDIILTIVNSEVKEIAASGTSVLSNDTDIANVRLLFENGCVANVTASRVSLKTERKMRFFQHDACISVDFQNKTLNSYKKGDSKDEAGVPQIIKQETHFENSDAIMAETTAFVDAIRNGSRPIVSGEEGKRALQTAIRISELLNP
ncbi:MAG: Gfo/Idh/MocA family oxidoreductase [Gammaproteobacteria bacterium]|nr:Gfo/Idh/MocA family oxidoreductase [Gammaproteobacteria bacterium]